MKRQVFFAFELSGLGCGAVDCGLVLSPAAREVLNLRPEDYVDKTEDGCSTALMTLDVPRARERIMEI